jgi:putative FmdB family regulatory protein
MPLYEYECDACGERYELIRKFSDPPLEVCPKCGQGPVRKLVSSPAFHLKGSGWYKTDYAPKSSDTDKPAKSSSDSGDKPAGKTESPASKGTSDTSDKAAPADKPAADKPAATSTSPGKPEKT